MPSTRAPNAIVQLKARMREPLRAQLEASAKQRGVSLNTELVERLEQSFAKEDSIGDPEVTNMTRLMAAAFLRGGQRGAHARKHPKWMTSQWIHDPLCYESAVAAVVDALRAVQPMQSEAVQPNPEIYDEAAVAAYEQRPHPEDRPKKLRGFPATGDVTVVRLDDDLTAVHEGEKELIDEG